jgi:protein-S-isoprenylcysteine O-methyltransferase Ste14
MNPLTVFFAIVPLLVVAAMIAVVPLQWPMPGWRLAAGLVASVCMVLISVARLQLGRAFSLTPQARVLVTRGLYSRIRNPVYVFGLIGIAALFVYLRVPILLIVFVLLIPMQILRARAEARVLEEKFGDEYRRWRKQTWF